MIRRNPSTEVYSPAVDNGNNIISVAWVGDEDVFAILHAPKTQDLSSPQTTLAVGGPTIPGSGGKKFPLQIKVSSKSKEDEGAAPVSGNDKPGLPRVELKGLVGVSAGASQITGSVAAATATLLGDLTLRGRGLPTDLFGGPVLCVASRQGDGMALFYSRKEDEVRAGSYIWVGPTLPYPDYVCWDDEGRLCAVVVGDRVALYLSEAPNFTLLGTARIGSPSEQNPSVTCAKFVHGVLYLCTKKAVQCVFLDVSGKEAENTEDSISQIDSYILASSDAHPVLRQSWTPIPVPMALLHPSILTYKAGSLLLSTVNGIFAIPLNCPLLRIGSLLASNQLQRAQRWFEAVPVSNHEDLANFLERRGVPEMAIDLPGLSLESLISLCLRFGFTKRLEMILETHGLAGIRRIQHEDLVLKIGIYLLSQGKAELVRRLATECMSGEHQSREAFALASLLLAVDTSDARRLLKRAVGKGGGKQNQAQSSEEESWPVGHFVRAMSCFELILGSLPFEKLFSIVHSLFLTSENVCVGISDDIIPSVVAYGIYFGDNIILESFYSRRELTGHPCLDSFCAWIGG
eukprot:CAMPEP_0118724678 /NCGR_PEP_ID=MMETSP0800-20121206/32723_1 /TAXON_ID=210618 ORGANISM="Striatella unipunctata, Strain CCMP2910" /NCGR_SAMPLE_ID=MMETSP0800 /ASSEMBLY_ACC=CAM_ASM_000638 /LENGTH=573 /DNA_ID=CAMNT_0006633303 /DNA_START=147 /DNA_END=1869 /DNA_ORIENTATION=-